MSGRNWNRRDWLKTMGAAAGTMLAAPAALRGQEEESEADLLGTPETYAWKKPARALTAIVIGAGGRGGVYSSYARGRPGEWRVVGVAEPIRARNEAFARAYGIPAANRFATWQHVFDRQKFGTGVLTFPDRVRLTVEAIQGGKGVMFLGGWLSFTGEMGKGGWNRTRLREVLPVRCLDHEDLVESTEGFTATVLDSEKEAFSGIDFDGFPPILGYNQTIPREDCPVLLAVKETGDPLVAVGHFGRGRTLAYTSDPAPHWGCNFVFWGQYADFWLRCLTHVLG